MHLTDSLYGVEPIELEGAPIECFCEVAVAREVLLLDLEICRAA